MEKEIISRGIKIIDIAYLTIIYFLIGSYVSIKVNEYQGIFDPEKYKDKRGKIMLDVIFQLIFIAIFFYITRNIVELIPFPLDGVSGFEHKKVKELGGGFVLIFSYFLFQDNLKNKIFFLFK